MEVVPQSRIDLFAEMESRYEKQEANVFWLSQKVNGFLKQIKHLI